MAKPAKQRKRPPRKGEGRPPYKPTDKDRTEILAMAGYGMPQEEIALVKGMAKNTLRKYYRDVLTTGSLVATAKVTESLYNNAVKNGNVTAQIFWLKNRAPDRWQDRVEQTVTGKVEHEHTHTARDELSSRILRIAERAAEGEGTEAPDGGTVH